MEIGFYNQFWESTLVINFDNRLWKSTSIIDFENQSSLIVNFNNRLWKLILIVDFGNRIRCSTFEIAFNYQLLRRTTFIIKFWYSTSAIDFDNRLWKSIANSGLDLFFFFNTYNYYVSEVPLFTDLLAIIRTHVFAFLVLAAEGITMLAFQRFGTVRDINPLKNSYQSASTTNVYQKANR